MPNSFLCLDAVNHWWRLGEKTKRRLLLQRAVGNGSPRQFMGEMAGSLSVPPSERRRMFREGRDGCQNTWRRCQELTVRWRVDVCSHLMYCLWHFYSFMTFLFLFLQSKKMMVDAVRWSPVCKLVWPMTPRGTVLGAPETSPPAPRRRLMRAWDCIRCVMSLNPSISTLRLLLMRASLHGWICGILLRQKTWLFGLRVNLCLRVVFFFSHWV